MFGVHPVHRRLAELTLKAERLGGGWTKLSRAEQKDIHHCLLVNAQLIFELDKLKTLSFMAHETQDADWQADICRRIDELESKMF